VVFGGLGFLAMFKTENEAGTAVALVVAGILLLIAIQGSQLLRVFAGEHGIELADTRAAIAVQATAEPNPLTAEAILDAYEAADPNAAKDPAFSSAKALNYELQAKSVLERIAADRGTSLERDHVYYDFVASVGTRKIVGEIKFVRPGSRAGLPNRILRDQIEKAQKTFPGAPFMLITNDPRLVDSLQSMPQFTNVVMCFWLPDMGELPLRQAWEAALKLPVPRE
jgi:hypothetical protein